jgi:NAD(P)-dependent dehydrogenase (short-subunit alcohol dehydrogenase family)
LNLSGATALVTGGASGLGLAATLQLAAAGARVFIVDLVSSAGEAVAAEQGAAVSFVPADVTDPVALAAGIAEAEAAGPIRALVHTAGRGGDRARIVNRKGEPAPLDSFLEVLRVNLAGTYNVLRLVAASMAANTPLDGERGVCVLTASVAAFDGQIGQTAYAASKAGVAGMTLVAARDLATLGIRVNTIAPGTFDTPMLGRLSDDVRDTLAAAVPFPNRLGEPSEYGALALHLLQNAYLNGETIRLDGAIRMAPR